MAVMLDYTSRIDPHSLIAAGAIGVSRYLSVAGLSKVIHKPEYDELVASGIDVTLNWEFRSDDWLNGASAGTNHAVEAVRQANALGYPKGKVIVGSADIDMSWAQWTAFGRAYAAAFSAGIRGGGFRPGVYGPWDVLQWVKDAGYMDAFWQAGMSTAWSAGRNAKPWPGAHFRQRAHLTVAGTDTDYSDILINPLWGKLTLPGRRDIMVSRIAVVKSADGAHTDYYVGDGLFYTTAVTWHEVEMARKEGASEASFTLVNPPDAPQPDWKGHVGRTAAPSVAGNLTMTVTQDMLNNAVAANVAALATALATHLKVV